MIEQVIRWSIYNRFLVVVLAVLLALGGLFALFETPVDAIPDLSDVQVIIKTPFPGQAPQVVEDQVTYPLTSAMLAVPHAVTVRGYSFFGNSYVYVIFSEGTDLYWARTRVLEYLSQVTGRLPSGVKPQLGPDATGVGWIYEYALVDRSGAHDLSQLRSLQDWFLKYELQAVPGVAEVATVGGMVKQYQVVIDPDLLRAYDITLATLRQAIRRANQEAGASVVELAEAEYMVRATGYISGLEQLREIPLGVSMRGTPLLLGDVADVHTGPQLRRGIAELNGEGEVVGGIIVMRWGENARKVIGDVKGKLRELEKSLPDGVEIVETYDRSGLISRTIDTLRNALLAELLLVTIVCILFLLHLRSVISVIISLPLGILMAFLIMYTQGVNANIMSLGGIAIAIGVMVDAAVVMIDNVHKHLERGSGTRGALADRCRRRGRSRASVVLCPADYRSQRAADLYPSGAGRTHVFPPCIYLAVCLVVGNGNGGNPRSRAAGVFYARTDCARCRQSRRTVAFRDLPSGASVPAAPALDDVVCRAGPVTGWFMAADPPRSRVYAGTG